MTDPGSTPYYNPDFYDAIKYVVSEGLLRVSTMTTKQLYRVLLERNVTMKINDPSPEQVWIPAKCEVSQPGVNWDRTWLFAKLKCKCKTPPP